MFATWPTQTTTAGFRPPSRWFTMPPDYGFGAASALAIMSSTEAVVIGW